ncbi:MAG: 6-carboxytetrahydropterin synthase [Porticoccaceae bacterium]|nr:6-carboxytetrahydropterin synthase [Porticoccaceae bacterium]
MARLTTIEIKKQDMHFSAAHFTIFSASERERLHGHNFYVAAEITGTVKEDGLCFDYVGVKQRLRALCRQYDEYTLIAARSPYLSVTSEGDAYIVVFDGDRLTFKKAETLLLPVSNVTIEELAHMLLSELLEDTSYFDASDIVKLVIKVSSGPGQWGSSSWTNNTNVDKS